MLDTWTARAASHGRARAGLQLPASRPRAERMICTPPLTPLSRPGQRTESAFGVPGDPNYKAELTLAATVTEIQASA
jgi:hypothetical protein